MSTTLEKRPRTDAVSGPPAFTSRTGRFIDRAQSVGPLALRTSLAVVFVWFGGMKIAGYSPVGDLIEGAVPFIDGAWFIPALGAFEVILGLALLSGGHALVVLTTMAHLAGTFAVFVFTPEVAFQGANPLLLTMEGEFVVKNLVLIAAALTVIRVPGIVTRRPSSAR